DPEAEGALCDLLRELGHAEPLARRLEAQLARATRAESADPEVELALRLELADLCAGALQTPAAALGHYTRLLVLEPSHPRAFAPALAIAEQLDRHEEALHLIDARLAAASTSPARAELLEQRGDLLAGALGRSEEALASYREVLELEPRRSHSLQRMRHE